MSLTDYEQQIIDNIEEYDVHITGVLNLVDDPDPGPTFTYSTGLYQKFQHPEIIIFGLDYKLSHQIINGIRDDIANDVRRLSADQYFDNLIGNFDMYTMPLDRATYKEYARSTDWYYQHKEISLFQLVYPTTSGVWPWDEDASEDFLVLQPIIGTPPKPLH